MKRNAVLLLVTLLTFIIGVGAAVAWLYFPRLSSSSSRNEKPSKESSQLSAEPEVPVVPVCDLVRKPDLYDKKIIRIKAILSVGKDTRTLWASACKDSYVSGECFHPPDKTCEGIFTAIDKFRGGEKGGWLYGDTVIDVIGQFSAHGENGRGYELEMLEIKDAQALNSRR